MTLLTTDIKGQIALLKVLMAAANKGATVSLPTTPLRYDLVLDWEGKLYRAQVKYADGKSPHSEGAIRVDLRRRKRQYSQDEVDILLVYVAQVDRVCWFGPEVFHQKAGLHLRTKPAKNGQAKGCLSVENYIW
jgi:hypothetical protein